MAWINTMAKQSLLFFLLSFPPSLFCARESDTIWRKKKSGGETAQLFGRVRGGRLVQEKESKPEVVKRLRSSICELLTAVTWSLLSQLHSASPAAWAAEGIRVRSRSGRSVRLWPVRGPDRGTAVIVCDFGDVFTENGGKSGLLLWFCLFWLSMSLVEGIRVSLR